MCSKQARTKIPNAGRGDAVMVASAAAVVGREVIGLAVSPAR
jgi:hypothetical protein